jgi:hypothetical protein
MAVLAKAQQSQRIRFLTPNSPHGYNRQVCYDCHYAYFLAGSDQYKVFTTVLCTEHGKKTQVIQREALILPSSNIARSKTSVLGLIFKKMSTATV